MLDAMRRGASSWVSKLLLGLLIISFGLFWGISDVFRGFGSNTVAEVGSTKIGATEFDQAYRRELDNLGRRRGRPIGRDEALRAGLPSQMISRMVTDATLSEAARRLGVGVSDAEIVRQIQTDPNFVNASGQFSRQRFADLLRSNGWSEDQYVQVARSAALRQQVVEAVAGAMPAPKVMLEAINQYRNEERTVAYLKLDPATLGTIDEPSAEALAKFFEERKAAFRAPEYRKIVAIALDTASLARPGDVTDQDAREVYQRTLSRFGDPEKRRVEQIAFETREEAAAALEKIRGGATFEAIVAERNLKPEDIDLGLMAKTAFLDPAVAEAAFKLEPGAVSDVVTGRFRPVILRLAEVKPAGQKPFEEVKDQIKTDVARERASAEVMTVHDQIEDARAGGARIEEVAQRFSLKTVTVEVDKTGRTPQGTEPTGLPEAAKVVASAFESDVGVENETIPFGSNGFLFFEVAAITPARDRTLDEVRADLVQRWKSEEIRRRLGAKAVELVARLEKGDPIETVASENGLEVKTASGVKRGEPAEGLSTAAVNAAFGGPAGYVATALGDADSRIVLRVADVTEAAFFGETEATKALDKQLANDIQTTLLEQYARQLRTDIGISINQQVLARLVGTNPSP